MKVDMGYPDSSLLTSYLQERLPSYFDDQFEPASIELINEWTRPASKFFRFQVDAKDRRRFILTKAPLLRDSMVGRARSSRRTLRDRPRLAPLTGLEEKYRLEHNALLTIQDHFSRISDPRFGAVRVLDFVHEHRALVMEELHASQLSHQLLLESRVQCLFKGTDLRAPFYNAGAWLRTYHSLPGQDQIQTRQTRRADVVSLLGEYTGYMADVLGDWPFFRQVFSVAAAKAYLALPADLPLGLGHGDYAMRNILVGADHRVTVLDTLAKWRTPIYEDIAYFLVDLSMNKFQALSQGAMFSARCLNRYAQSFLDGYFEHSAIAYRQIRLYELLILLDKWSSQIARVNGQSEGSAMCIIGRFRLALFNRYFRQRVCRLLEIA